MRKLLLPAALAIALALGWYAFFNRTPQPSGHQQTELPGRGVVGNAATDDDPFDVTISITDRGFATTSVTIKKGTRVRFLNESTFETWPASGIHPTHTLYPEKEPTDCLGSSFDACAALKSGQFFDFTFNYVGRWPFHDHLRGYWSGEIVVTE